MPHITFMFRHDSRSRVMAVTDGDQYHFMDRLEAVVADGFYSFTGEILDPGHDTEAHPPILTNSCPMDLVVTVAAYWDSKRDRCATELRKHLQSVIESWYARGTVKVEVHLNLIGAPKVRRHQYMVPKATREVNALLAEITRGHQDKTFPIELDIFHLGNKKGSGLARRVGLVEMIRRGSHGTPSRYIVRQRSVTVEELEKLLIEADEAE